LLFEELERDDEGGEEARRRSGSWNLEVLIEGAGEVVN